MLAGCASPGQGDNALDSLLIEVVGDAGVAGTVLPLGATFTLNGLVVVCYLLVAFNARVLIHDVQLNIIQCMANYTRNYSH